MLGIASLPRYIQHTAIHSAESKSCLVCLDQRADDLRSGVETTGRHAASLMRRNTAPIAGTYVRAVP